MAGKRMTRADRRSQLLETALGIVRSEGVAALTLVRLAERAGVSRPVAYEHFKTQEGLLLALYREYDERLSRAIRDAVAVGPGSLEDVAAALSAAYVDGVLDAGPECEEVDAALAGHKETRGYRRESRDFYVREFAAALAPCTALSRELLAVTAFGIFGATEGLARAAAAGRVSRAEAVSAATSVIVGALRTQPT